MNKKRILALLLLASAVLVGGLPFTSSAKSSDFKFQKSKVTVGTVYHYLKTNIDGTHPEHVSTYVATTDTIESFKFHPKSERAGLVIASMDWNTFSVKRLESWQVFAGGKKTRFAVLTFLPAQKAVQVSIPVLKKKPERTTIPHIPFHVYNFDLASLNFAFRHLVNPKGSFTIGIADPTFKEGPMFAYRGEVTVSYVSEETRNGVACRKYKIDGPGLANRGGSIWVNQAGGYFEDIEIDLPDNPDWQSFKFKLEKTEQMDRAAWEQFMAAQF